MAKRGFFAELNYQAQQTEKRRQQQEAAAYRAQAAQAKEVERRHKAAERARAAAEKAAATERKAAERESARLYAEARMAEVKAMNGALADTLAEIDGMLEATIGVDDYVDLATLKIDTVEHPPFEPGELAAPRRAPDAPVTWPEPVFQEPPAPTGLAAAFGGKKRHEQAVAHARAEHEQVLEKGRSTIATWQANYEKASKYHQQREAERTAKLEAAETAYADECRQREEEAEQHNKDLAELINGLAFDVEESIQEYVGIVLSNSVYPEAFPLSHDFEFSISTRELTLEVSVPEPSLVPSVKEYKYVKSQDEITSTNLALKAQRDRYASAVWQVAVRSLHEVFEADRAGKIHSIALTVGVEHTSPATGRPETVPLAVVAVDRETFNGFNLESVVPHATLTHLGAALSKSPFDLTPADTGRGVRTRAQ